MKLKDINEFQMCMATLLIPLVSSVIVVVLLGIRDLALITSTAIIEGFLIALVWLKWARKRREGKIVIESQ